MRIFISRRGEVKAYANQIALRLRQEFPNAKVFHAADSITSGDEWMSALRTELLSTDFFILVIDSGWIEDVKYNDRSYVRLEAEVAIVRSHGVRFYVCPIDDNYELRYFAKRLVKIIRQLLPNLGSLKKPTEDLTLQRIHNTPIMAIKSRRLPLFLNYVADIQWPHRNNDNLQTFADILDDIANTLRNTWDRIFRTQRIPVMFIGSTFYNESSNEFLDFFGFIVGAVARSLNSNHTDLHFDCVVKLPSTDHTSQDQNFYLSEALQASHYFRAIVISPFSTSDSWEAIKKVQLAAPHLPVFTIDKSYLIQAQTDGLAPPAGVINNWLQGGRLAADAAVAHFKIIGEENPKILIVRGLEGSSDRVDGFIKTFLGHYPNSQLHYIDGAFQTEAAANAASSFALHNSGAGVQLIMCANDEMALGARKVLIEYGQNPNCTGAGAFCKNCVVVGYDGIEAVTQLMRSGDRYMLNTVDVCIQEQVRRLATMIIDYFEGKGQPSNRVQKLNGRLFRTLIDQNKFSRDFLER